MKKIYTLGMFLFLISTSLLAQPTQPTNPAACNSSNCTLTAAGGSAWDACAPNSTTFVSNMSNEPAYVAGTGTGALTVGAVYRYTNIGTSGLITVNATVTIDAISNAILADVDDNGPSATDQAGNSVVANFSPRISPDVNLTATRRGYVQFTIRFYNAASGNGFSTLVPISNLVFVHYDNDGSGNATNWFRETGVAQQITPGNPTVLAAGGGTTELVAYNYTDGGNTWNGFAGSVCERTSISKCAEVAEAYRFSSTPISALTFRLGYDHKGNAGVGQPTRQYGARFTCFGPSPSTLPVSITNFSVSHRDGIATLLWTTSDEDKFKKFEIERSVDGRNFYNVSNVASRGASRITTDYEFADDIRNVSGTTVFYRLRMVDADEKFSFSNIVSVRRGFSGGKLNISPNPASSNVVVRFESLTSGMAEVTISDISGRIVLRKNNQLLRGSNNITIPEISGLTEGVYQIRIVHNGESKIDQLVIKR